MRQLIASFFLATSLTCLCFEPYTFSASPSQKSQPNLDNDEFEVVAFNPPAGWRYVDTSEYPHVKLMVVGEGKYPQRPSINLTVGKFSGTLKDYLKSVVKPRNDAEGSDWKDLGMMKTEAGNASLSQYDRKGKWGDERAMQVIMVKNGKVYILTASAIKDEFSQFYKDFFTSMRSLRISKDVFDLVTAPQRRTELKKASLELKNQWQTMLVQQRQARPEASLDALKNELFGDEQFQTRAWIPFKELINQKYQDMGAEWQKLALETTENNLFQLNI